MLRNFFAELKRRNVYKVAIAYGVVAWLLMQVASQIFPFFEIPNWAVRLVVLLLIIGFPVALILAWAFELTPEGIKRAEDVDLTKSTTRRTSHKLLWITAVVAIVAAALFVSGRFNLFRPKRAAATAVASDKSIAVLPFDNLSRDPDNAYFAEGIQDEILARLSKIADLKVISRTSTQKYKSAPGNLREIAQQLGVSNILEGSVQKSADQVRVTVQLINALTDTHLWAEIYDRKLTDIFAVESDVAKTIAETLRARLTGAEESAIAARPTENSEAHELYLRGRYFFGKRGADNLKRAIDYFNQAIAKDPNYAPAYAGIADSYAILSESPYESRADALNKARVAAEKALALDSKLAEAHVSRGLLFVEDLNLKAAEQEYQRAIELNPNYAFAHYLFGFDVLTPLGDFDHAISEMNRAVELDPFSGIINANLGWCYLCARRYPEAAAQFRKAAELDPNSPMPALGLAHELSGQREQAITAYQRAYDLDHDLEKHSGHPADPMLLAVVYALKGERAKELQQLEEGKAVAQRGELPAYFVALAYARLGDKNEAIEWLQRSYQNKEIMIADINVFPPFDPLRSDPRFEALAEKVIPRDAK
jgi:TolB-like protein/Tfp pilus assembly protein PilF